MELIRIVLLNYDQLIGKKGGEITPMTKAKNKK